MDVDPTDATPVQAAVPDELDDFLMGDGRGLVDPLVVGQEPLPSPAVAHQELSKDEFVPQDLAVLEKIVESSATGGIAGKELDPDRRIDQDH